MSSYFDPNWYGSSDKQGKPPDQTNNIDPYAPYPATINDPSNRYNTTYPVPAPIPPDPGARFRQAFRRTIVTVALVIIAFIAGWFGHQFFSSGSLAAGSQSQQYSNLFQQAWSLVDQKYVDRKAINYQQMSYSAIQAMLGTLHDTGHTRFLTPAQVQAFQQSLSPTIVGIGVYIQQDPTTKKVTITDTMPTSPAERGGLKGGDVIIAVNGQNVVGQDLDAISKLLHGQEGTDVSITVQRPATKQTLTVKMKRAQITVPNVIMHYIPEKHIAHIQMVQFASGATDQLRDAVNKAKQLGATSIILDLRGNPGGLVDEAIQTVSTFLQDGTVYLQRDSSGQDTPYDVDGKPVDAKIPIVVLIDNGTGSSAEIVSGSLQDNKRATLIGATTFGTGTVLNQYSLSDGSAILLGTGEWLTPKGHFIRNIGIKPDIAVSLKPTQNALKPSTENENHMTYQQILASGDAQLIRAIQYLDGQK